MPGDVISVVEFFFLATKVLGTKLFAFREGYSSFPERLARGIDVRLGAPVRQVIEGRDGVTRLVSMRERPFTWLSS